jgi:hypothetical protein
MYRAALIILENELIVTRGRGAHKFTLRFDDIEAISERVSKCTAIYVVVLNISALFSRQVEQGVVLTIGRIVLKLRRLKDSAHCTAGTIVCGSGTDWFCR